MPLDAFGWNAHWRRLFEPHAVEGLIPGRVIGEHRTHFDVAVMDGDVTAEIPGRLRHAAELRSDLPGVGDFVALTPSGDDGPAIIEALLPRKSVIIRQAAGERRPQLVAANVDVVFVVTALDGDFSLERTMRYLTVIEEGGATPVIIINKADIGVGIDEARVGLRASTPNVPVHIICAHEPADVMLLERYFDGGRTIAMLGSSGVGKSTLTNKLLGREAQATQAVRAHDNRGRHTTTHRQLFVRDRGGVIMDTPGMRALEPWEVDPMTTDDAAFEKIDALATECKFRNCGHQIEPSCAVRAAVERGEITPDVLERYLAEE